MEDIRESIEAHLNTISTTMSNGDQLTITAKAQANILDEFVSRKFDTGAQRDSNASKPFIHTLLGYTRLRFGYHMNKGARKYGNFNFTKGIPTDCYLESLDRHLAMYMSGDRTEDHLSEIIFNAQGCMLNEEKEGIKANHFFDEKSN